MHRLATAKSVFFTKEISIPATTVRGGRVGLACGCSVTLSEVDRAVGGEMQGEASDGVGGIAGRDDWEAPTIQFDDLSSLSFADFRQVLPWDDNISVAVVGIYSGGLNPSPISSITRF